MRLCRLATSVLLYGLLAVPAFAGSIIEVVHPWVRPTIPNRPGVAYFGIHNSGEIDDRLIGARAEGIGEVEIHRAMQTGDVMSMAPVAGVDIPAGGMAHLGPGGFHLMMFGIDPPLKVGDTVSLLLIFETAGEVPVTAPVTREAPEMHEHDGGHQHGTTDN